VIIIKEGTLKCTIGNRTSTLSAGSVLLIPPYEEQIFENTVMARYLLCIMFGQEKE
jgi:mannose-6-phosphate isomerase-like protein (cupin superfamily)